MLTVMTVPWNLMSRLASNPHQTSDVSRHGPVVVRRFSFDSQQRSHVSFDGQRPSTIYLLQPCPFGHPEPSRTLIPLAHPKVCEAS